LDERLVGVAFLDVGVYVTSLRCIKNLLLIGDNSQGTWFVAFQVRSQFTQRMHQVTLLAPIIQEDPFKLVILSKGRQNAAVSNANFFFGLDGQLSFITAGEDGVLRAFEFLPHRMFHGGEA
jgi:cleavage and polyadenylation specificity factor subunit 1